MRDLFEVVIAGGGPAGLALALHLARDGAAVAVIEPRARRPRFGETLPPGNRPLLAQLGIWEAFAAGPHARCEGTMAAWGAAEVHYTDYLLHPERHGWRIDRHAFEALLRGEAARHGAAIIDGAVAAAWRDDVWRATTDGGTSVRGRVLVDATGRSALIARRLGARKLVDDQLVGVAGVLETAAPAERDFPLIESRQDGWLYSSVLPDGRLAVVAMTDSDLAHAAQLHDEAAWLRWMAAAPHTARRTGDARCVVAPAVASACSQRLDRIAGDGWLAVGDAASALDPLSSLGIVKALRGAADAAAAIRAGSFETYARSVADEYDRYLDTRARYYAMETRWPDAPFWQRRYRSRSITKSSAVSSVSFAGELANGASAARARSA